MGNDEIGIVLVSHGKFAFESIKSAEMIAGPQERVKAVSVVAGMGLDETKNEINEAIDEVKGNGNVLIMTDILGGTPSNAACMVSLNRDDILVITGYNMPMLLEIITQRSRSLEEVSHELTNIGKESVVDLSEKLRNN